MPGKGKGSKKGGKNSRRGARKGMDAQRELPFAMEGQAYAQVTRRLGGPHLEGMCFATSGSSSSSRQGGGAKKRLLVLCGSMRNRGPRVKDGDFVLVGLRDYQDSKADVILLYTDEEARRLKGYGELPDTARVGEFGAGGNGGGGDAVGDADIGFDFEAI